MCICRESFALQERESAVCYAAVHFYFYISRVEAAFLENVELSLKPSLMSFCASFFFFSSLESIGRLHHDDSLSALLLPGIVLLGPHRGLAELHGSDGQGSDQAHPQALSVPGLG